MKIKVGFYIGIAIVLIVGGSLLVAKVGDSVKQGEVLFRVKSADGGESNVLAPDDGMINRIVVEPGINCCKECRLRFCKRIPIIPSYTFRKVKFKGLKSIKV